MGEEFDIEFLFEEVREEMRRGDKKYGKFDGPKDGLGTIKCEVEELAREINRENPQPGDDRKEAMQLMMVAAKYIRDCCGGL